jgi:8-oxo-dGTP pyrophosphatase MutT (NUDIX family)
MFEPPDALPIVRRMVVRLVVVDSAGRVLLLHTRDPTYPELGTWWELPGGGVEPGEALEEAAVRELYEETSIRVDPRAIRPAARWHRHASFRYRGTRHVQCETVVTVELSALGPQIDGSHRERFEDEDYFDFAWGNLASVLSSGERFYPERLPLLLPRHLGGGDIEEPFELWS